MPLYNVGSPQSIYPGSVGTFMGSRAIPGFATGFATGPDLSVDRPEVLPAGGVSRPVVIAAQFGRHPSTQRQLVWRTFFTDESLLSPPGPGLSPTTLWLEASIDNKDENYVVIAAVTGDVNFQMAIPNDPSTGEIEDAGSPPTTIYPYLSSYRYLRIKNAGSAAVAIISDCASQ